MPLQFEPKTKKQLAEERLLPSGEYQFVVIEAMETKNKQDQVVIEMYVRVDSYGQTRTIRDYLTTNYMAKVRAFCEVAGLEDVYATGHLTAAIVANRAGWCRVAIEDARGNQPRRNSIAAYIRAPRILDAAGKGGNGR